MFLPLRSHDLQNMLRAGRHGRIFEGSEMSSRERGKEAAAGVSQARQTRGEAREYREYVCRKIFSTVLGMFYVHASWQETVCLQR